MHPNRKWYLFGAGAYLLIGLGLSSVLSPLIQWLDSPALTISASHLAIAHPPGEPLFSNLSHLTRFIPVASLPLRLCLLAIVVWLVCGFSLSRIFFPKQPLLVLALTAILSFSFATWTQLVRQELYLINLAGLVVALTLYFSLRQDQRSIYLLAFLTLLAAATHTLLALVGVGAIFCLQVIHFLKMKKLSLHHFLWMGLFALMGAVAQLYLPLRALQRPLLNFGDPSTLVNFLWVVSARLYSTYDHPTLMQLYENFAGVAALYLDFATPPVALLALVGCWRWVKKRPRDGRTLLLLIVLSVVAVLPNTTFDLANPDLFGYLLPGMLLFFLVGLGNVLTGTSHWLKRGLPGALVILLITYLFFHNASNLRIYATPESDRFELAAVSTLPYKSKLSLGSYHTFSQLVFATGWEGMRPDLCLDYRGDPRGGATQSCNAESTWYEPAIARDQLGETSTRESPALLKTYQPNGMFLAPHSNSQSLDLAKQKRFWEEWFPTEIFGCGRRLHPGIRRQLSLEHLMHGKVWQAHQRVIAAAEEITAACLEQEPVQN